MPLIFGIDVQALVSEAVAGAGGLPAGALTKTIAGARDPDHPSRLLDPTTTTHALQAVVERRAVRRAETDVAESTLVMTIIAGSITPVAIPAVNDRVTLDGRDYTLVELLEVDPAEATYQFEAS